MGKGMIVMLKKTISTITTKKMISSAIIFFTVLANIIAFQNCAKQPGFVTAEMESKFNIANRCYFDDKILMNGESVIAYQNSTVVFGGRCIYELRTCQDAKLTGSYRYSFCQEGGAVGCLFNGNTIEHGKFVRAYFNTTSTNEPCKSEERYCTNGALSGTYQFAYCNESVNGCLFNGQTIPSGGSIEAYQNSSVPSGQNCQREVRSCNKGTLSGSYQFASCNIASPSSCYFNGQTIANGEIVKGFLNSSEPFGGQCREESRTCASGKLSGSYQFSSCNVGGAISCLFNGVQLPHGQEVTAFEQSTVPANKECISEKRKCSNGSLTGSFYFPYCKKQEEAGCIFGGRTLVSGENVIAYESANVAYGNQCKQETRICFNGSLSGSYMNLSCNVATQVIKKLSIQSIDKVTSAPFKLLISVVNSNSLSPDYLERLIKSLAPKLKGKDVDVKLINGTDIHQHLYNKKYYVANENTDIVSFDPSNKAELSLLTIFNAPLNTYYVEQAINKPVEGMRFKLSTSDSDSVQQMVINQIISAVMSMPRREKPFINLLKTSVLESLYSRGSSFFSNDDAAGFLLIGNSDEYFGPFDLITDLSTQLKKTAPKSSTFEGFKPTIVYTADNINSLDNEKSYTWNKSEISEGIDAIFIDGYLDKLDYSTRNTINFCKPGIGEKKFDEIKNNLGLVNPRFKRCSWEQFEDAFLSVGQRTSPVPMDRFSSGSLMIEAEPNVFYLPDDTDLCKVTNFYNSGKSIGKYYEQFSSKNYFYKCFYDPEDRSKVISDYGLKLIYPTVNYSNDNATKYSQDYISKILINMKNKFKPNNFFINLYVHKPNSRCMTSSESVASNLLYAETIEPTIVKSYSLCDTDFSMSLDKMNTTTVTVTQKDYSIGSIDRSKIVAVNLIRSGNKMKLLATDYDLTTVIGKIYFNTQLQTGDQFEIEYYE